MSLEVSVPLTPGEMVDRLATDGWAVCDGFLDVLVIQQLMGELQGLRDSGAFRRAAVGRGQERTLQDDIRQDQVRWLDPGQLTEGQQVYWEKMETMRLMLNRHLYLGLFDYEAHLAVYPRGAFYKRHLDQFRGLGLRTVSSILYLREGWTEADGGQLRLYLNGESKDDFRDIFPVAGRLVMFMSADFYHEVLTAHRERWSVTGWFRRRGEVLV